ncbi:MAG: ribbon-helix-helix protein, CopG family [Candidatus Gastranaerophilaceae bacterium]
MARNCKQKQFSLNNETIKKIEELAELLDRPKSNIVKIAINEYYMKIKEGVIL